MCEIEKQLNELLAGTKPTQTTKAQHTNDASNYYYKNY